MLDLSHNTNIGILRCVCCHYAIAAVSVCTFCCLLCCEGCFSPSISFATCAQQCMQTVLAVMSSIKNASSQELSRGHVKCHLRMDTCLAIATLC